MKKIITFFAVVGLVLFSACEGPEGPPGQDGVTVESEVFEVTNIDFESSNNYSVIIPLQPAILNSDMVLVYRLVGSTNSGADIWKSLPETYYFDDGTRDVSFNFDFSVNDVAINLEGENLATVLTEVRLNQIFRIVIITGYLTGKSTNKKVNFSDYNAVIKAYGIDDSNVERIN